MAFNSEPITKYTSLISQILSNELIIGLIVVIFILIASYMALRNVLIIERN